MRWPAEAVWEAVSPLLPGFTVEVLPEIASTNTELMRRARAGQTDAVVLVAERQTAGRGRLGRPWHSSAGDSLTFSLGLMLAPADWSGLSLAVGVGIAESLDPRLRLKWPNDLWLDDRKLGGILIETASASASAAAVDGAARYTVIGVGINIAAREADGLATPPAWMRELLPEADAGQVLLRIAAPLVRAVKGFEREGFAAFSARFEARDALQGRAVAASDGTVGCACGTNEIGALLVHTALGMKSLIASDVSVRPAG